MSAADYEVLAWLLTFYAIASAGEWLQHTMTERKARA